MCDDDVDFIREQVAEAQGIFKDTRSQILELVAENQRLNKQLKNAIVAHIQDLSLERAAGMHTSSQRVEHQFADLEQKLLQAQGDKESIVNMWHLALKEVDKLEHELADEKFNPQVKVLRDLIDKMQEDHRQVASKFAARLSSEVDQTRQLHAQLRANEIQSQNLKRAIELSARQLSEKQEELDRSVSQERMSQKKVDELQETIGQLHLRIESANLEAAEMDEASVSLQNGMTMLHSKMRPLKVTRLAAIHRAKENIQLAEDALQERDAAVVREKQALREADRLRAALAQLVEEAGAKTTCQVETVKTSCNGTIEELLDEMKNLELSNNETKSQLEKASREKQTLIAKLTRTVEECDLRVARSATLLEATQAELERANRVQEAVLAEVAAANQAVKDRDDRLGRHVEESKREHQTSTTRQRHLSSQVEALTTQKQSLAHEVQKLQLQLAEEITCHQRHLRDTQKELSNNREDWDVQKESLEAKLAVNEEMHALTVTGLNRKMTTLKQAHTSWQAQMSKTNSLLQNKIARLETELREWRSKRSASELLGAIDKLGRAGESRDQ